MTKTRPEPKPCKLCDGWLLPNRQVCQVCWPEGLPEGLDIEGVLTV